MFVIWNIPKVLMIVLFETSIVFFNCYYHHYYFIAFWRWFLICIHSNFGSTFFGLISLEFFFESIYALSIYLQRFSNMFVCFIFYIYVFSMSLSIAEKRIRFPQGLSFLLGLYFRIFFIVELWVLVNLNYKKKIII